MNVNEETLEDLKCCECDCYLSIPPIMINRNYENVCGRCYVETDEEGLEKNYAFEALATHLLFPCRYKMKGCKETLPWNRAQFHEEGCEFQTFECLISPIGSCGWEGPRSELLAHFEKEHPDFILEHPCVIKPNIRQNSQRNFLISAHGFLFLLQTKCSVSAAKLCYCVRFLGYANLASLFDFTVDMNTCFNKLKKTNIVATQKDITFEKDNFIEICINSLLVNLGDYSDISFSLTVNKILDKYKVMECFYCGFFINSSEVKDDTNCCKNCSFTNKIIKCCKYKHLGCSYYDTYINVKKHEKWLCIYDATKYQTRKCILCRFKSNVLNYNHFENHNIVTLNTVNRIYSQSYSNFYNVIYDNNIFTCFWKLEYNTLVFKIISNLSKTENKIYTCTLRLFNPCNTTSIKKTFYHNMKSLEYDWIIKIKNNYKNPFVDVKINYNYSYYNKSESLIHSYGVDLEIRRNDTLSKLLILWNELRLWPWKYIIITFWFSFFINYLLDFIFSIDFSSHICPEPVLPICPEPHQPSLLKTILENIYDFIHHVFIFIYDLYCNFFGLSDEIYGFL